MATTKEEERRREPTIRLGNPLIHPYFGNVLTVLRRSGLTVSLFTLVRRVDSDETCFEGNNLPLPGLTIRVDEHPYIYSKRIKWGLSHPPLLPPQPWRVRV